MDQTIEKSSPSLGREAQYAQKARITRLPANLVVHMVRFAWRRDIGKKAKIMRRVRALPFRQSRLLVASPVVVVRPSFCLSSVTIWLFAARHCPAYLWLSSRPSVRRCRASVSVVVSRRRLLPAYPSSACPCSSTVCPSARCPSLTQRASPFHSGDRLSSPATW